MRLKDWLYKRACQKQGFRMASGGKWFLILHDDKAFWVDENYIIKSWERIIDSEDYESKLPSCGVMFCINDRYHIVSAKNESQLESWLRQNYNKEMYDVTIIKSGNVVPNGNFYIEQLLKLDINQPLGIGEFSIQTQQGNV